MLLKGNKKMNNLPKIMSISLNSWRQDSNLHTEIELFKFWDSKKVSQIYTRSDLPNTNVCNNFFQISENQIIKSVLNRKNVGKEIHNGEILDKNIKKQIEQEKKLYAFAHRKKTWFFTLVREIVWDLGKWKSDELDLFIKKINPDIYFIPIYPVIYTAKIQEYILRKYKKPYVSYIADDNFTYTNCGWNMFSWIHRFLLRKHVEKLIKGSDGIFVINEKLKDEIKKRYNKESVILTKGIHFESKNKVEWKINNPIKILYTGNLLIGRKSSIVEVANAVRKINSNELKIIFDIYSPTEIDNKTLNLLNSQGVRFHGNIPYSEVVKRQNESDILLFAESLENKFKKIAWLSFSTKITDYLKAGKCIFAIGDSEIAPIEYLEKNKAAIVVTDLKLVEKALRDLIDNPIKIKEFGEQAFNLGLKNHNEEDVKTSFVRTICNSLIHSF